MSDRAAQITLANPQMALQSAVRVTARRQANVKIKDVIDIVDATSATLSGSSFDDVNLSGTVFNNVNLAGARFNQINFSGASFADSNMSGWSIDDVNFTGLKLSNANLSGAQITACRMTGMKIDGIAVEDLLAAYRAAKERA